MLLSNRRLFLISAAAALAGCGFRPAFQKGSVASQLRNSILLRAPSNKNEFDFVKIVEDQLGHVQVQKFQLDYGISVAGKSIVVTTAQEQQRVGLTGTLRFTLTNADGDIAARGSEKAFTSYSTSGSTIATETSQADANLRLMRILVDQMIIAMSAKLA